MISRDYTKTRRDVLYVWHRDHTHWYEWIIVNESRDDCPIYLEYNASIPSRARNDLPGYKAWERMLQKGGRRSAATPAVDRKVGTNRGGTPTKLWRLVGKLFSISHTYVYVCVSIAISINRRLAAR